jgi:hypothetical protein
VVVTSFAQVDFNSTTGDITGANGTVSNWLITPELNFTNSGVVSFFARTIPTQTTAEFLEVRQSNAGTSTGFSANPGATALGSFTTLVGFAGNLLGPADAEPIDIPFTVWRQYTFNVAATSGSGRLAFRFFGTDGGPNGSQAGYATIDTVNYAGGPPLGGPSLGPPPVGEPEPSSMAGTLMMGGLGSAYRLRNKAKKAKA